MSDRDLLEAAARAGGYTPVRWTDDGTALLLEGVQEPWNALHPNPHSDCMGDALRLAVGLGMTVCVRNNEVEVFDTEEGDCLSSVPMFTVSQVATSAEATDPYAATCRAIVRAAALTQPEGGA